MTPVASEQFLPGPHAPGAGPMEQRAHAAVMHCIASYGVSKTTLDDVAREAGCSRATLYRYFPNKSEFLRSAVHSEVAAIATELVAIGDAAESLEEAVVAIVAHGARRIVGHDALQFVLRCESDVLLPYITFASGDEFLAAAGAVVSRALRSHLPPERVARAGEWIARVAFAYLTPAGSPVEMTDDTQVRELVSRFVLPGLLSEPVDPVTR